MGRKIIKQSHGCKTFVDRYQGKGGPGKPPAPLAVSARQGAYRLMPLFEVFVDVTTAPGHANMPITPDLLARVEGIMYEDGRCGPYDPASVSRAGE